MNLLTSDEIKKELELAIKIGDAPIGKHFACTISKLTAKSTLELINTYEEEISRLKKDSIGIDNFVRDICKERILEGKSVPDFETL